MIPAATEVLEGIWKGADKDQVEELAHKLNRASAGYTNGEIFLAHCIVLGTLLNDAPAEYRMAWLVAVASVITDTCTEVEGRDGEDA